jgi:hypothetical protein
MREPKEDRGLATFSENFVSRVHVNEKIRPATAVIDAVISGYVNGGEIFGLVRI